jgi:uncharacterized membrane protein YraQ (UPF0718 family)
MTTTKAHILTAISTAIIIGVIVVIVFLSLYNSPQQPPIDPRTIELKEVAKDSLNAAQPVKIAHDETVKMAENVNSSKPKMLIKWEKVAGVRRSLSDSLQAQMLIDRLNK